MANPGPQELLLLVDDDRELCRLVGRFLGQAGYRLLYGYDGREGASQALASSCDLVLLDVTLPLLDGFAVLHRIRRSSDVPVIMLTSRSLAPDRLAGFNGGADDYLCKPFEPEELLARIRAVLRRAGLRQRTAAFEHNGTLRIGEAAREVMNREDRVALTATEFELLLMLHRAAGRVVPREALVQAVQDRRPSPYDRSLDVHVSHLRAKLGEAGLRIRTVRNTGYFLVPEESGRP